VKIATKRETKAEHKLLFCYFCSFSTTYLNPVRIASGKSCNYLGSNLEVEPLASEG